LGTIITSPLGPYFLGFRRKTTTPKKKTTKKKTKEKMKEM